jgi:DNA-binding LytR/AlgR family response regulator
VVGLGGLGHMGVKFGKALGAEVTVLSTSPGKKEAAMQLGADHFIISRQEAQMKAAFKTFDFVLDTVSGNSDVNPYLAVLKKVTFLTTHFNKRHAIEQTLEELESELDPTEFFRISRQFIISVKSIAQIHQSFNGKLTVQLTPATTESILASREKSAGLKRWLDYR